LYRGGTVLTLDGPATAEALVTEDERIVATGSEQDMSSLAGSGAERVDLAGSTLMPGLIDSHPHALHFAAGEVGFVNLLDAQNHAEICARLEAAVASAEGGQWIRTTPVGEPHYFVQRSWRDLSEGALPDRHLLDRVAPHNPVHIMAWAPTTPNVCVFNSKALEAIGLSRHYPEQVCSITLERDADGELTGRLFGKVNNYYGDDPFWQRLTERIPPGRANLWFESALLGLKQMNERGVTAIYEGHAMMPPHIEAYLEVRRQGRMTARVLQAMELSSSVFNTLNYTDGEVWGLLELGASMRQVDDPLCRVNGVTLSRGGPAEMGYFRQSTPYFAPDGALTTGRTFYDRDLERRVARTCLERDIRFNMVLGGYQDHDDFIETCDELAGEFDIAEREWVLQHCMTISQRQVDALAKYRFHATTSMSFVYGSGELFRSRFGGAILKDLVPLKRIEDSAMNLACGTDWGPGNIFAQIALNETRIMAGSGRRNWHEDHIITREQALAAFTRNPARMMQWDGIGSLAPGNYADLVIVDRNPLTAAVDDLPETRVLRTILGGETVYEI
jgi:predicted amidohydrolase YtcJ